MYELSLYERFEMSKWQIESMEEQKALTFHQKTSSCSEDE